MASNPNEDLNAALIQAADYGLLEWAKQLIASGVDINGIPLLIAIQANHEAIVEERVAAGADLNRAAVDTTPLVKAIHIRRPYLVKLLVRSGADVNLSTPDGITPLMAAHNPGRANATHAEEQEIISILIQAGAQLPQE
jgi:ankyrin repeat protein